MSSRIRNCVKEIGKGNNIKEMLPDYVEEYMKLNGNYSRIKMMMEYYMFYETISEGINPYIDSAKEIAEVLHELIEDFFEKENTLEQVGRLSDKLLALRQEVVERMQVLTAYVDCFVVYEYILNRVQYRFDDQEMVPEDSLFARDLVNFIFSSQDNAVISDNVRFAVGQLPMRMTRSRYFELIRDSISVYKGSDKSSLEGFLYMFRTNAMLYKDSGMGKYFTEFVPVIKELGELDYENIDRQTYELYAEKIRVNASKLNDVSDLYMQLGQLINDMYGICTSADYMEKTEKPDVAEFVIRAVNALFLEKNSDVWKEYAVPSPETEEEKLYLLGEQFADIEGKQEQLYESMTVAGAALEEIMETRKEEIDSLGLNKAFTILRKMFFLPMLSLQALQIHCLMSVKTSF